MSDLISRQAAIDALGEKPLVWDDLSDFDLGKAAQWSDDVDAIKNLQPTCNQLATDCISRQDAIDALKSLEFRQYMEFGEYVGEDTKEVCLIRAEKAQDALQSLPSAQPQRIKGRWIRKNDGVYCSACYKGWDFMTGVPAEVETEYKFCPNCGARMTEGGKNVTD